MYWSCGVSKLPYCFLSDYRYQEGYQYWVIVTFHTLSRWWRGRMIELEVTILETVQWTTLPRELCIKVCRWKFGFPCCEARELMGWCHHLGANPISVSTVGTSNHLTSFFDYLLGRQSAVLYSLFACRILHLGGNIIIPKLSANLHYNLQTPTYFVSRIQVSSYLPTLIQIQSKWDSSSETAELRLLPMLRSTLLVRLYLYLKI